jgi:hypothetical protein
MAGHRAVSRWNLPDNKQTLGAADKLSWDSDPASLFR